MERTLPGGRIRGWRYTIHRAQPAAAQGLRHPRRVLGAFARKQPEDNAANMRELFQWFREGRVRPYICARFPLEQAAQAMELVAGRGARGKVVITVGS
ncbi:zinc-binding dehydrogenase [Comamonas endophytica]|uniref:zinc-binding dehydrogenase n=1 Tax=Comamonas endophytica TaxID=2949090 RepID=UPI00361FC774